MERLGDVVVGALVEPFGLFGGCAPGSQEDHRDGSSFADLAHDFDSVQVGHDDVEQDYVRPDLLRLGQRFLAARRRHDPEPLVGQGHRDELGDALLVVGDQNQGLGAHEPLLVEVAIRLACGATVRRFK